MILCMQNNTNEDMRLQIFQQNILLLWKLNNNKHIGYITELLRCHTIIVVTFN